MASTSELRWESGWPQDLQFARGEGGVALVSEAGEIPKTIAKVLTSRAEIQLLFWEEYL